MRAYKETITTVFIFIIIATLIFELTNHISDTDTRKTKSATQEEQVYIPKYGNKYHFDRACSNGNFTIVNQSNAISMGYTPCKKCVNG